MGDSREDYIIPGTPTFTVNFPYLARTHVLAYLDDVSTAFTWDSDTVINFGFTPPTGTRIAIVRKTPSGLVNWTDGASMTAEQLNNSRLAAQYRDEEHREDRSCLFAVANASTTQTITAATQVVEFDTVDMNEGQCWDPATWKYTAPVTGLYEFSYNITHTAVPASDFNKYFQVRFRHDTQTEGVQFISVHLQEGLSATRIIQLDAGDTVYLDSARVSVAGQMEISGGRACAFSGRKIG